MRATKHKPGPSKLPGQRRSPADYSAPALVPTGQNRAQGGADRFRIVDLAHQLADVLQLPLAPA
ncbi:hypothetical protein RZS08_23785, partial [Arthrospira platensis SPKY1]|nr:hypothetical protein [Arthrospira platensis SPKY1]